MQPMLNVVMQPGVLGGRTPWQAEKAKFINIPTCIESRGGDC